ncbi:hypothetical protein XU18_1052 [Perkinsela sp. CCAP 1560/4]|nr:hypothetical protein XU18_1052 [Perkinsela sp. CCAP 1560/4]|eukprot:KNH08483.1 hypothetical protein XU18_1052 [Perkinsela sp. CCAP 1560/4]
MLHFTRLRLRNSFFSTYEHVMAGTKGDIRLGYCTEWNTPRGTGKIRDDETDIEYTAQAADLFFPEETPNSNPQSIPPFPLVLKVPMQRFLNVGEPVEFEIFQRGNFEKAYKVTGCGGSPLMGHSFSPSLFQSKKKVGSRRVHK